MARGSWLHEGVDPLPPPEGDKYVDREALEVAGGVQLLRGRRVLDIGPCYGVDARDYAPLAACYVIFDYDTLVLEWVKKLAPMAIAEEGDARDMKQFPDCSFDVVFDFGSFDNTGDPHQCYKEACRVLVHGGTFITTYGNLRVLGKGLPGEDYSTPEEVKTWLEEGGLTVIHRARETQPRSIMIGVKQ